MTVTGVRSPVVRRDLAWAAGGLVAAIVATSLVSALRLTGAWATPLAYLAAWVPLVAVVVLVCRPPAGWRSSVSAKLGLRFSVLDVFWGVAAGCLARAFDASVNLMLHGNTGLAPQPIIGVAPPLWLAVVGLLAAVLLAPVIEEVFFRGLLQRALVAEFGANARPAGRTWAAVVGVVVASAVFALMHLAGAGPAALIGTFAFGLVAGALTAVTGRIGGAIVAHVVFNGIAVALMWPY